MTWDHVPPAPTHDFNEFLHDLRGRELRKMPPGGTTLLSGGAAGGWYFEWVRNAYPSVTRHIGVEAYQAKPNDLPPEAEWIANYLGNMHDVRAADVDLVFAGQTVEHMWPDDLANFLCESHRVLRPGGVLVLDSPNRRLTKMLGWHHPQHTAEYDVHEIAGLVAAAGFRDVTVRGVWLCYAREDHAVLPIGPLDGPAGWPWQRRVALSADRPEDCFVWWLEARKDAAAAPDRAAVTAAARAVYDDAFAAAVTREFLHAGVRAEGWGRNRTVRADAGGYRCVAFGPYAPLRAGGYVVRFGVGRVAGGPAVPPGQVVCEFDVASQVGELVHAKRSVTAGELAPGAMVDVDVPLALADTTFGLEFRAYTTGAIPLVFRTRQEVTEATRAAAALRG